MEWLVWAIALIGVGALLVAAWRFLTLRSNGTAVVLRRATGSTNSWRHGTLIYNGDDLQYFKLRSLAPAADQVFNRTYVEFNGHRAPTEQELVILSAGNVIVQASVHDTMYEFSLDPRGAMALIAWIESAPSERLDRVDRRDLLARITRNRGRK